MSGVTVTSRTWSPSPTTGPASAPTSAVPAGSTMMPSWSSPRPSSRSEAIIPSDTWPYVSRLAMAKPPARTAPGRATTTRSPTTKLLAPQTIPRIPGVSGWPCAGPTSTWHQRIGFLKPVSSSIVEDPADDERPGDVAADGVDLLELEPGVDHALADVRDVDVAREVDVLPQPGQRDPHQTSMPNCVAKRTSPSTMSRMSVTSCRNIRVRSTPMPKANPE